MLVSPRRSPTGQTAAGSIVDGEYECSRGAVRDPSGTAGATPDRKPKRARLLAPRFTSICLSLFAPS